MEELVSLEGKSGSSHLVHLIDSDTALHSWAFKKRHMPGGARAEIGFIVIAVLVHL